MSVWGGDAVEILSCRSCLGVYPVDNVHARGFIWIEADRIGIPLQFISV